MESNKLTDQYERQVNLIISLLTGSINNVERLKKNGIQTKYTLEKIKQEIILYDTDQTRFIYDQLKDTKLTIQGVSGSGKTELLLHKLKDIYMEKDKENKVVLTCFNKTLAASLRKRVPVFFDFMKVSEQIKWEERLWVMHSWGSQRNKDNQGLYAQVCLNYGLKYYNAAQKTFKDACQIAIEELSSKGTVDPMFDYILIDESQDFNESFFELCSIISRKGVYIAGDVFQNIFQANQIEHSKSDYNLSICYRTDPRTLMLAHAIGFGMHENVGVRKLTEDNWKALGYIITREEDYLKLERKPIRKFNNSDILNQESAQVIGMDETSFMDKIIKTINNIRTAHPDFSFSDLAIVSLDKGKNAFKNMGILSTKISNEFSIKINLMHDTKIVNEDLMVISNINNIKGLEYPFVIVYSLGKVSQNIKIRNSLYMAITRSYLQTYLLLEKNFNSEFINIYKNVNIDIQKNNYLKYKEQSKFIDEKELELESRYQGKSHYDIVSDILSNKEYNLDKESIIREAVGVITVNSTDPILVRKTIDELEPIVGVYDEK